MLYNPMVQLVHMLFYVHVRFVSNGDSPFFQCEASFQAHWSLWPIPRPLLHFGSPLPSSLTKSLPIHDYGNVDPSMCKF